MTPAEMQLQRISRARGWDPKPPKVHIYKLDRGFPVWLWLCAKHLAARLADRWTKAEGPNAPPHPIECQDCPRLPMEAR